MKKTDLAYLAGIFDGEGSIVIHKNKPIKRMVNPTYVIEANVYNTNEWIIRQFHFSFGGGVHLQKRQMPSTHSGKCPIWVWQISANKALPFLKTLLPYLKLKRGQVEIAIKFQEEKVRKRYRRSDEKDLAIAEATKLLISNLNKGKQPK